MRRKADPHVVELLEEMLEDARAGYLTGLFAVFTTADGCHGGTWATDDLNEMLFHVRTEAIGARAALASEESGNDAKH